MNLYEWCPRPVPNPGIVSAPGGYGDLPDSIALLLARRGLPPDAAESFLDPAGGGASPAGWRAIASVEPAARRIIDAVSRGERILVHGDFDADGMTSTALACRLLGRMGAETSFVIPDRLEDGYGLGDSGVARALESDAGLVLTVDCGTNALQAADSLSSAGVDLIVTDHHESSGELPRAVSVVNPVLDGPDSPFRDLAGVGVAYKLAEAVVDLAGMDTGFLDELVDLVAVGTICDIVPLLGENRALVSRGLQRLRSDPCQGLRALASTARMDLASLGGSDVAFGLGPRLNACGRVGNPDWGVELLITDDASRAAELSALIDRNNHLRRSLDRLVYEEASQLASEVLEEDRCTVVLASERWHQGVLGIAASRLARETGRPTVLISLEREPARGSARSAEGFEVYSALERISDLLEGFGGHPMAAGLTIERDRIPAFAERFERVARESLGDGPSRPKLYYDGELEVNEYTLGMVRQLSRLEPFGEGNREPVWMTRRANVLGASTFGGGRHLRLNLEISGNAVESVGFNMGKLADRVGASVDAAFTLSENRYSGRSRLQLILRDLAHPAPGD